MAKDEGPRARRTARHEAPGANIQQPFSGTLRGATRQGPHFRVPSQARHAKEETSDTTCRRDERREAPQKFRLFQVKRLKIGFLSVVGFDSKLSYYYKYTLRVP